MKAPRAAKLALLPAALALGAGLVFLAACGGATPDSTAPESDTASALPDQTDPEAIPEEDEILEPTVTPLGQSTVRVYFPSTGGDGLIAEYRDIFDTTTPGDRAKQIIAGLLEGPESSAAMRAVPRGTNLRQAYVLQNGTAYLDFSRDLAEGLGGGSMREMLAVYAIVDSVVRNVPEIKSVGLLIEGNIPDTLNGHLDLRYPLRPNYSMVLRAEAQPDDDPQAAPPVRIAAQP